MTCVVGASKPPSKATSRGWVSPSAIRSALKRNTCWCCAGSLAHNVVVWARSWLNSPRIARFGILRMVRDVFHISGLLRFDTLTHVVEIVLNQDAHLARLLIRSLRELLAPFNIVVNVGET